MNYSYRLHPLIRKDYDEAYEWYEEKQKGLGERFIKAVRQTIEQIVLHPETYGRRSNKKFREVQVNFFPYLVVYKVNKQEEVIYISSIITQKNIPEKNTVKYNAV